MNKRGFMMRDKRVSRSDFRIQMRQIAKSKRSARVPSSRFGNGNLANSKRSARVPSSRFGNGNLANSKRSMEMIISILIVIALALLVFGVLAYVFSGGFAKFWSTIKGYFSSDVDAARNACDNACKTQSKYSYCCVQRDVNFGKVKENITCMDSRIKQTCSIDCSGEC